MSKHWQVTFNHGSMGKSKEITTGDNIEKVLRKALKRARHLTVNLGFKIVEVVAIERISTADF